MGHQPQQRMAEGRVHAAWSYQESPGQRLPLSLRVASRASRRLQSKPKPASSAHPIVVSNKLGGPSAKKLLEGTDLLFSVLLKY